MYLTCRSKEDNAYILKYLEVSGFLGSEINASNCKASEYHTDQLSIMDIRAFCFEAIVQSWASNFVLSSVFSFAKTRGALIFSNHFGSDRV